MHHCIQGHCMAWEHGCLLLQRLPLAWWTALRLREQGRWLCRGWKGERCPEASLLHHPPTVAVSSEADRKLPSPSRNIPWAQERL